MGSLLPSNQKSPLVFLCHTGADRPSNKPFVAKVNRELESLNIPTFFDEHSIDYGETIPGRITEGIRDTGIALVFISNAFFGQKWPNLELDGFIERLNRNEHMHIVPINIGVPHDYYERITPKEIRKIKYVKAGHEDEPFRVSKVVELVWKKYQEFDPSFKDKLPRHRGPNDELLYTCCQGDTFESVAQGLLNASIKVDEILKANEIKHDEFVFGTNIIIPHFDPKKKIALRLHIQEKQIEVWNHLVNVFRRIKGYRVDQIYQALRRRAESGGILLPGEELVEGTVIVLPKLTERKDGAILHLVVQSEDTYWEIAETIHKMQGSPWTVPVEWQPNPDGATIFQPGATVSTHPSSNGKSLEIWVCDDDKPETVMYELEQLCRLDVNQLTNHLIASNLHFPPTALQPGNVIVIKKLPQSFESSSYCAIS